MPFDIKAAKKAGYTDEEIIPYLQESYPDFNVNEALQAGYSLDEVGTFLKEPAPAKKEPSMLGKVAQQLLPEDPLKSELDPIKQAATDKDLSFRERLALVATGKQDPTVQDIVGLANPFATSQRVGKMGLEALEEGADIAGEKTAEFLASKGLPPEASAALGLGISEAPFLAVGALKGPQAAKLGAKALRRTTLGAIKGEKAKAGVTAAREVAGIQKTAETVAEPRTRKAIIEFTDKLEPLLKKTAKELAEIADVKTIARLRDVVGRVLDSQNVAKFGKSPKTLVSSDTLGKLARFKDKATKALTQQLPKYEQALAEGSAAFRKQALGKGIKETGKSIIKYGTPIGIATTGIGALLAALRG